jgi:glucose-1-phosphate cytidylyltransferase
MTDMTIDLEKNHIEYFNNRVEPWKITLLDTGLNTMTGGRISQVKRVIKNEPFMLTYGDGLADINIKEALSFHRQHGKTLTVTSAQPEGRFGALHFDNKNLVTQVSEKPKGDGGWVNAGFFICEPKIFDFIQDEPSEVFEQTPLQKMSKSSEMYTYKHKGFWRPMDTLRDKIYLQDLWDSEKAPWKIWA